MIPMLPNSAIDSDTDRSPLSVVRLIANVSRLRPVDPVRTTKAWQARPQRQGMGCLFKKPTRCHE